MSKIVRHLLHATSSGNDPWDNRFEPDYIWCDLDSAKDFRLEESQLDRSKLISLVDKVTFEKLKPDHWHLAQYAFESIKNDFRYTNQDRWAEWNGKVWQKDRDAELERKVPHILTQDANLRAEIRINKNLVNSVTKLAKSMEPMPFDEAKFDSDLFKLNTPTGLVDLKTGEIKPHKKDHLCTKMTLVGPEVRAAPVFSKFLKEITCGDDYLANYLQQLLGSTLSGAVSQHWIAFFEGSGANGKSVLMDTIGYILGTYATHIRTEALMLNPLRGSGPSPELAKLEGMRLAIGSEVSKSAFLDDERVKTLTGDGVVVARDLYKSEREFERTNKTIVLCNNMPRTREVSRSMKRRVLVVPFKFEANNPDPMLGKKLLVEGPMILNWLIEGHVDWMAQSMILPKCDAVAERTKEYFQEQPTPEKWLADYCHYEPNSEQHGSNFVSVSAAYENYKEIFKSQGYSPVSLHIFSQDLSFVERIKSSTVRLKGVTLRYPRPFDLLS